MDAGCWVVLLRNQFVWFGCWCLCLCLRGICDVVVSELWGFKVLWIVVWLFVLAVQGLMQNWNAQECPFAALHCLYFCFVCISFGVGTVFIILCNWSHGAFCCFAVVFWSAEFVCVQIVLRDFGCIPLAYLVLKGVLIQFSLSKKN